MLKNITPRERMMLAAVIAVLAVTFAWLGVYEPLVADRQTLKRKIAAKKRELGEVEALALKVIGIKERFARLGEKIKDGQNNASAVSSMEALASSAGIGGNIVSMSPIPSVEIEGYKESVVDMKMEKVSLVQLKTFLESMMRSPGVMRVKRISIKPQFEDASVLDVSVSVARLTAVSP